MSSTAAAVSLTGVTKTFDGVTAVQDLTLEVAEGALFGLLGPNGAGKTTTLRLIVGIHEPDAGTVRLRGRPPGDATRDGLGYLPEERGLYPKMEVLDQLAYLGRLKGLTRETASRRARAWLERLGLAERATRRLEELSKGMQQKVQLAAALLHEPAILILDEPFAGLDPVGVQTVIEILRELHRDGRTIVLSTHRLEQAEELVGEICLVHRARVLLAGELREIKRRLGRGRVLLDWSGDPAALTPDLVAERRVTPEGLELGLRDGVSPQEILRGALETGEVRRFQLLEPSLREIYVDRVREDGG